MAGEKFPVGVDPRTGEVATVERHVLSDGDAFRVLAEVRPQRIVALICQERWSDGVEWKTTAELWLSEEGIDRLRALLDEAG